MIFLLFIGLICNGCDEPATTPAAECAEPTPSATPSVGNCGDAGNGGMEEAVPRLDAAFQMGMMDEDVQIQRFDELNGENNNEGLEDCLEY